MARHFVQWLVAAVVARHVVVIGAQCNAKDNVAVSDGDSSYALTLASGPKTVSCPKGEEGAVCLYKCKSGYMPEDGQQITCTSKTWTLAEGKAKVCVVASCAALSSGTAKDGMTLTIAAAAANANHGVPTYSGSCGTGKKPKPSVVVTCVKGASGYEWSDFWFHDGIRSAMTHQCASQCLDATVTSTDTIALSPTDGECADDDHPATCWLEKRACAANFALKLDFQMTCGTGNSKAAGTVAKGCEKKCTVDDSKVTADPVGWDYGEVVNLHNKGETHAAVAKLCRGGWEKNDKVPTCKTAGGKWDFSEVKCKLVSCTDATRQKKQEDCDAGKVCKWKSDGDEGKKCSDYAECKLYGADVCGLFDVCKLSTKNKCVAKDCKERTTEDPCKANTSCFWDKSKPAKPVCRDAKCSELTMSATPTADEKKLCNDLWDVKATGKGCVVDGKKCKDKGCAARGNNKVLCAAHPATSCEFPAAAGSTCKPKDCANLVDPNCGDNAECKTDKSGAKCAVKACEDRTADAVCKLLDVCEFTNKKCVKMACEKLPKAKCDVNGTDCQSTGGATCKYKPMCNDWAKEKCPKATCGLAGVKCVAKGCADLTDQSGCGLNTSCKWGTSCKKKACGDHADTGNCNKHGCTWEAAKASATAKCVVTTTKGPTTTAAATTKEKVSSADRTSPASLAVAAVVAFMAVAAGEAKTVV